MRHSLFIVLAGLILSPAAQAQTGAPPPCALREPDGPRPQGLGTVVGIRDAAVAHAHDAVREAQRGGAIDPHYRSDVRAVVRQDDGIIDTFDVSDGMTVHAGERVRLQGSYRSTAAPCSYIPHLIIPNDVPAA
jgi:hypothetical protein